MARIIIVALIALAAWQGYGQYQTRQRSTAQAEENDGEAQPAQAGATGRQTSPASSFKCDGRTYCSQMTSCAEAAFFLNQCPGVKMDGNHDGVPCEKQWCGR